MDHLLLWAVIALFVLILGATWQWLRKLELRSRRRRGNNYLYQEYNYDHDTDHHAIDLAWESYQDDIQNHQSVEENLALDLDSEEINTEKETRDDPWKEYQNHLPLHQVIEDYLNLESDGDLAQGKEDLPGDYLSLSAERETNQDLPIEVKSGKNRDIHNSHENPEVREG
ncbi:MAG: hypothetical protein QNJ18_13335 [Xenococcaceae cyanobacterium MO_167.B52]|nr:hypothetical protein [Xenococcaceae cyanobacterium MO_167.B52]